MSAVKWLYFVQYIGKSNKAQIYPNEIKFENLRPSLIRARKKGISQMYASIG